MKVRFYTFGRILRWLILGLTVVLLPALIAAFLGWSDGRDVLHLPYGYGAAWYCLSVPCALILWFRLGRSGVYDYPVFREIMPNGRTRRVRSDARPADAFGRKVWEVVKMMLFSRLIWLTLFLILLIAPHFQEAGKLYAAARTAADETFLSARYLAVPAIAGCALIIGFLIGRIQTQRS